MIDPQIKRTVVMVAVVVALAKILSAAYDAMFVDSQEEVRVAAQQARNEQLAHDQQMNLARNAERRAAKCLEVQKSRVCTAAKNDREIRACLTNMRSHSCDNLPRIHYCAAVQELEKCADPFADQKHNGCESLRRVADCRNKPAPNDREHLWQIGLDDGLWDGD